MTTVEQLRAGIDACVSYRDGVLRRTWKTNVNYRAGKPFETESTQDRVVVPEDWARARQKTAALAFQLPKIIAEARQPQFAAAAPVVTAFVNQYLLGQQTRAAYAIDEALADVVNAAGLMAVVVGVDQPTEALETEIPGTPLVNPLDGTPMVNPDTGQPLMTPARVEKVRRVIATRFTAKRLSPAMLLWPVEFSGSDWDEPDWLGYDSYLLIEEIKKRWPQLRNEKIAGSAQPELLADDVQTGRPRGDDGLYARVQTVWYKAARFDADKTHPDCLRRLVFLEGRAEPIEGPEIGAWQKWIPPTTLDGEGHYVGLTRFPIRVKTLVYVSDLAIPPSDTQAGRPQVNELSEARSQQIRQRRSSIGLRWYDVNRLDESTVRQIETGEINDLIPVNGPGDKVIGEIARASTQRESFESSRQAGADLDRAWSMSANQMVATNAGERSAAEVNAVASANDLRLAYEKGRVSQFVAEIAEVLFSLAQVVLPGEVFVSMIGPDGAERLQAVTQQSIAGHFAFNFKTDSSDRIDIRTKLDNLLKLYNLAGNSQTISRQNLEKEIVEAMGHDPDKMTSPPKEKGPEPPNISYRFNGADLLNPIALALMIKSGHDIGQDAIRAAQMMINDAIAGMPQAATATMIPTGGGPPPPPGPPPQAPVEPPTPNEPILKRLGDGTRMGV